MTPLRRCFIIVRQLHTHSTSSRHACVQRHFDGRRNDVLCFPATAQRHNNVVATSPQRQDVAAMLQRRCVFGGLLGK